ncbi:MAG TPA: type II toxin-antitoxin system RelE/ParE family toxin [Pseudolabrys sp.]|jgi:putative addiction module killer protein|nr:type II toxin-antitoxin system RelE/ParE family toxin [Pseudolabrys sp.]
MRVVEYLDGAGRSPFRRWFDGLDAQAAAKIAIALSRIEAGNLSNVKSVGGGVTEFRSNFGPGYRIYFGREGDALIILLGGGSKRGQNRDVTTAQARWEDYRRRRKEQH